MINCSRVLVSSVILPSYITRKKSLRRAAPAPITAVNWNVVDPWRPATAFIRAVNENVTEVDPLRPAEATIEADSVNAGEIAA